MHIFDFKSKDQIINLLNQADENKETSCLILHFEKLKDLRNPLYLDINDFDKILRWKLRGQYNRQKKIRTLNTDDIIKKLSRLAFQISHEDKDFETGLKIKILCCLQGIEIPTASAILSIIYPNEYAVIDYRVWRQLFGNCKTNYTVHDYLKYLHRIKEIAEKYCFSFQQIDMAIWQYDITINKI